MRKCYTKEQKKELMAEFYKSGKRQRAFAGEKGIRVSTFNQWLTRYRKQDSQPLVEVAFRATTPEPKAFTVRKGGMEISIPVSFETSEIIKILRTVSAI